MTRGRVWLPILSRHLVGQFVSTFSLTLLAFLAIYVLADFFDRIDNFLKYDAALGSILRSFLFKLPLVVSQVTPMAVLAGALISLGLLARQNEFIALKACGVSIWQVLVPLVATAALITVGIFIWNETIVPYSARRWHEIEDLEIKKRGVATVFTGREVWYHGKAGFYNINRVVPRRHALYGLTIYQLGPDFRPIRIVDAAAAYWYDGRWSFENPHQRDYVEGEWHEVAPADIHFTLPETPEDFLIAYVEPEEFSFGMLRRQIQQLQRKGIDASESLVDLHLKLALPAASMILMIVAVPLAVRGSRVSSPAASIGLGFAMGFSYFIVLGMTRALGQGSALPAPIAAWAANILFALLGAAYVVGSD